MSQIHEDRPLTTPEEMQLAVLSALVLLVLGLLTVAAAFNRIST